MNRDQRLKYEMFGRVASFGMTNRGVFPEESPGGKRFAQLAEQVAIVEEQLVQRSRARADGRKLKISTREAAMSFMKAVAATGRRVVLDEREPHAFRMPRARSSTMVLTSARLFLEQAEQRREQFLDLGMPPTFIEDFGKVVAGLADAVARQQGSRGGRARAQGAIDQALRRGMTILGDLDVVVPNVLGIDPARQAEWAGARRLDQRRSAGEATSTPPVSEDAAHAATEVAA